MTVANSTVCPGSPKTFGVQYGYFQFSGTTTTAEVACSMKTITSWVFNPINGTTGLYNSELIYMKEEVVGTAATNSDAPFFGAIPVVGTSVTVDRVVTAAVGTTINADGTGATGLWVQYEFKGYNK